MIQAPGLAGTGRRFPFRIEANSYFRKQNFVWILGPILEMLKNA